MTRALLLGGSGFLGRWVGRALQADFEVVALDRRAPEEDGVAFVEADARDPEAVAALVRPGDVFVHLFHSSIPVESMDHPEAERTSNVEPYEKLLAAVARAGAELMVYFSSGGQVYGPADRLALKETDPCRPVSAYGEAKLAMEQQTRLATARQGLHHLIIRPANPYGPHQERTNRHGAAIALLRAARSGEPFTFYGAGETVRDYVFVEDAARAVAGLVRSDARDRTFNVATGEGHTLSQLADLVEQVSGMRINRVDAPIRPSDVPANVLDVSALQEATGFTPRVSLEEGLRRTWEHLRKT